MAILVEGKIVESYTDFISSAINSVYGNSWNGLKIVEIGDEDDTYNLDFFVNQGMNHTLIQPVGDDGACLMRRVVNPFVPKNFKFPEQFTDLNGQFDVLTNVGTVEHLSHQLEAWQIMHDLTKVGGVMIHIMPDGEQCDKYLRWYGHCHNYFTTEFFENLASKVGYEIISNDLLNFNRSVALKKLPTSEFNISNEEIFEKIIIR